MKAILLKRLLRNQEEILRRLDKIEKFTETQTMPVKNIEPDICNDKAFKRMIAVARAQRGVSATNVNKNIPKMLYGIERKI